MQASGMLGNFVAEGKPEVHTIVERMSDPQWDDTFLSLLLSLRSVVSVKTDPVAENDLNGCRLWHPVPPLMVDGPSGRAWRMGSHRKHACSCLQSSRGVSPPRETFHQNPLFLDVYCMLN